MLLYQVLRILSINLLVNSYFYFKCTQAFFGFELFLDTFFSQLQYYIQRTDFLQFDSILL